MCKFLIYSQYRIDLIFYNLNFYFKYWYIEILLVVCVITKKMFTQSKNIFKNSIL